MDSLVFDLGGTYLRCGVGKNGSLTTYDKSPIYNYTQGIDSKQIWKQIFQIVGNYCVDHATHVSADSPIIFAVPTPLTDGVIYNSPTLSGSDLTRIDVASEIAKRTGRTVYVLNDVAAAGWWAFDVYRENRLFIVTVSSGIGSKLLVRSLSNPVIDYPLYAGEIGHLRVRFDADAPLCGCGQLGHLSAISSGRGVLDLAQRKARRDMSLFRKSYCGLTGIPVENLTNELHIVPAIKMGDIWAREVLTESIEPLAKVLAAVFLACGIEKIIVIGGFAQNLGSIYIDLLRAAIMAQVTYSGMPSSITWLELAREAQPCLAGAVRFGEHVQSQMRK